jgi:hypothetical protein
VDCKLGFGERVSMQDFGRKYSKRGVCHGLHEPSDVNKTHTDFVPADILRRLDIDLRS